jgi:hypothetical protein
VRGTRGYQLAGAGGGEDCGGLLQQGLEDQEVPQQGDAVDFFNVSFRTYNSHLVDLTHIYREHLNTMMYNKNLVSHVRNFKA